MKGNLQIFLYNRNLATPTLDQTLTDRVENLSFSTKLHGGFAIASFSVKMTIFEAWEWITTKQFYRLLIKDAVKTVWEGRLQDIDIAAWGINVTAYGYWASMRDQPEITAYNSTANVVIAAALTAHAPQINADQSHIDVPDVVIDSAADESYEDITIQDLVNKLLEFGDTLGNEWYFAIWEDRIPWMFAKDTTVIDWTVRLADLADFRLKHMASELWNSVYALYTAAGVLTRTATVNDTDSQGKYGDGTNDLIRRYAIPNLGEIAAASANAARSVWLAKYKEIMPSMPVFVLGDKVYDANSVAFPSSWVRAGDVIRITDLVPASVNLDSVVIDGLSTFYILETKYEAGRLENSLVVDIGSKSITAILAKYTTRGIPG